MIFLLALILLMPLLVFLFYKEFECYKVRRVTRHTPGPIPLPLLGNAHELGKTPNEVLTYLFDKYYEYNKSNYKIWIGWFCNIVINDAKDVEFVLSSNSLIAKSDIYDMFRPWFGDGLLTSKGEKWRKHRKMITPSFHFKILQDFHEVMNYNANKFINVLRKVSEGERIFDFQHEAHYVTLDIICDTAMGVSVNAMDKPDSEFAQTIAYLCHNINMRAFRPLERKDITYQFFPEFQKFHKAVKIIKDFTYDVIEKRIETRRQEYENNVNGNMEESYFYRRKMAFLDTLLASTVDGKPLTHQQIYEEVATFMFEGHDTTTSAISFLMFLLSRHAAVQQKVYEEQRSIMGDNMERDATFQEIGEMKYLDLVIKEAQRLFPSVPIIGRHTDKEYNMNGKIIPANTALNIFIMTLGYNEEVFEDPYRFEPERFVDSRRNGSQNAFEYVPFSAGPRNCIGQKFALLELKTVISRIIRSFQVLPALDELASMDGYVTSFFGPHKHRNPKPHKYDPVLSTVITLKSDNGIHLRLRERK